MALGRCCRSIARGSARVWARRSYALAAEQDAIKKYIADGTVSHLENSKTGAQVFLIGTAHVSSKSAEEVKEVIHAVKPNIVAVELCEGRARKMMAGQDDAVGLLEKIQEFIKFPGGFSEKFVHFAIKSFYQALREAGLDPGKEFKVAMEEAKATGAAILLIDQSSDITVARLTKSIGFSDVLQMIKTPPAQMEECMALVEALSSDSLSESIEKLKRREAVRQLMKFMENSFPNLVKAILHERDEIMMQKLLSSHGKIVAVVGMGHMDGIEKRWKQAR